jgi:hypothetical protein
LRRSAPREIAEAVQTLTAISDRALDLNSAELEDALAAPTAQRAYEQHASYLREHCGISFGGSDESGHRPHG